MWTKAKIIRLFELKNEGYTYPEIAIELNEEFEDLHSKYSVRSAVRRYEKRIADIISGVIDIDECLSAKRWSHQMLSKLFSLKRKGKTHREIAVKINELFGTEFSKENVKDAVKFHKDKEKDLDIDQPKVLLFDIETAPMLGYVWGLWENTLGLNQVESDWYVLSWSAKWLGDPPNKIMYADQRKAKDIEDDTKLLKSIWELLDEADIVIGQNSKSFDHKKLNTRFIMQGIQPPSSYRHIDTKILAKRHFSFTSNKLEYMTDKLCTKYKKLNHGKFSGFSLWRECLKGNMKAWKEMEKYNKYDVLSLEELYYKLIPWDNSINFNVYSECTDTVCTCGNMDFKSNGFYYTNTGKFRRYRCIKCGSEVRSRKNLLSKEKRRSLVTGTGR